MSGLQWKVQFKQYPTFSCTRLFDPTIWREAAISINNHERGKGLLEIGASGRPKHSSCMFEQCNVVNSLINRKHHVNGGNLIAYTHYTTVRPSSVIKLST